MKIAFEINNLRISLRLPCARPTGLAAAEGIVTAAGAGTDAGTGAEHGSGVARLMM
ncbi:MAG TPA: hypothetical protein VLC46_20630 [Thermoanaerobaculia bacterium]|nr:hypothetical protein [Thermoanaerobaculia bacterium]